MQRTKAFFYVCAGVFLLALSYHFGAASAQAQAPSNPIVAMIESPLAVVTANGDVYNAASLLGPWGRISNVFAGPGPTNVQRESFGQLKAKYR